MNKLLESYFENYDFERIVELVREESCPAVALGYAASYGVQDVIDYLLMEHYEEIKNSLPFAFVTLVMNGHKDVAEDLIRHDYLDYERVDSFVKIHNLSSIKELIEEKKAKQKV